MPQISAEIVKRIICEISNPEVILLRGASSILNGSPQNDIDLFIPLSDWDRPSAFSKYKSRNVERTGIEQIKVFLADAISETVIEVDIFHQITWRGLLLIEVESLPIYYNDDLDIYCLSAEAEVWVTILKNVIHGSPTPSCKFEEVNGEPVFTILTSQSNTYCRKLQLQLEKLVWTAAWEASPNPYFVWKIRLILISIRFIEQPLNTVTRFFRWVKLRVRKKLIG
ncbi:hypothetical protein N9501_06750 [Amylibacter sp.]|jgi:hypothetical protein|nr:hypothetical protein [Amylibacter sp.]MDC1247617.1 hypothetical protein [Amylibacter sp.]